MIQKIISGGQTGVDRAALDAAIFLNMSHGGYCPKGRKAEDGIIDPKYKLVETNVQDYHQRTELNVLNSDGTLIFYKHLITGGTLLTLKKCQQHQRPFILIDLDIHQGKELFDKMNEWVLSFQIQILNIAGPRESKQAIYQDVFDLLKEYFQNEIYSK